MRIPHPFLGLSPYAQRRTVAVLFLLTMIVAIAMRILDAPLRTEAAPLGIVSFEFARDAATAQAMIESWGEHGRIAAALSLGLDYLFLLTYSSTIALVCIMIANAWMRSHPRLATFGFVLGWAVYAAALLDAVENYALARVLLGAAGDCWPALAYWSAVGKFAIAAVGVVYLLAGMTFFGFAGLAGRRAE